MLIVKVKKGQKIEHALKKLKRKFRDVGTLKEIRKRKEFVKPSEIKRKQKQKAQYIQKLRDQESNG